MKQHHNEEDFALRKELGALEEALGRQSKEFGAKKEHCYALINKLEGDVVNLQNQNNRAGQVVEAREQQIGWLLKEGGATKLRIKEITDYNVMECHECENMTKDMFFASVLSFARQFIADLEFLHGGLPGRPATWPTDITRDPGLEFESYLSF